MKQLRVSDQHQNELVKLFNGLCGRYSRWEVWSDFITMTAISLSNKVDLSNAPDREAKFKTIAGKYSSQELDAFAAMLAELVMGMEENTDQDFLGELYMRLELGNAHAGQFFTPYNVCKAMVMLQGDDIHARMEEKGWFAVHDPACGAGALLVAFANECRERGVNYQANALFVAQDIDYIVGMMCYIQLSLLGCPGYVCIGDSLAHPVQAVDQRGLIPVYGPNIWYTPFYFRQEWHLRRTWARMDMLFQSTKSEEAPQDEKPAAAARPAVETRPRPKPARKPRQKPTPEPPAVAYHETKHGQLTLF